MADRIGHAGRRGWRGLLALVALGSLIGALVLPGTAAAATKTTTWKVSVGAQTDDKGIQANAFLTPTVSIDVGDTVTWTVKTDEIHTVTFLSDQPQPPLIVGTPDGPNINPVVAAPAPLPPTGKYDGTSSGYVNSGILAEPGAFSLTFTAAGDFPYLCQIHTGMVGTVHVAPAGTPYPHPQVFYDAQGLAGGLRLIGQGLGLQGRGLAAALRGGATQVTAGVGQVFQSLNGGVFVARFEPDQRTVHVGETVTWTNRDPGTPHTVTFGTEPNNPFVPLNLDGPAHGTLSASTPSVSSGVFGAAFGGQTTFSMTFTQAGTYSYICALHDELGMTGKIVVLP